MEKNEEFFMTTTNGEGFRLVKFLGIVNARALEGSILTQMQSLERQLHERARELGANAVIGLRITAYNGDACMGYGTAAILEPLPHATDVTTEPLADMVSPPKRHKNTTRKQKAANMEEGEAKNFLFPLT